MAPYDLGRESVGSGRGPEALVGGGAVKALATRGREVTVTTATRDAPFTDELGAVVDVDRVVAGIVATARRSGSLPLVAAGNCNVSLGVHAGLAAAAPGDPPAVIWLDAHGDFNTPETTPTGYLDGMPLAMLTGRAHREVWAALGAAPLDERLVLHAGGRDLDPDEAEALALSDVLVVAGGELKGHVRERLGPALDALVRRTRARAVGRPAAYLHVDIDVLDPEAAPGVTFPCPGGLALAELLASIALIRERFELRAVSLSSFTPDNDRRDLTLRAGLSVLKAAAAS